MKKLFMLLFLSACSKNECPCGHVDAGFGRCQWEYFFLDKRPQCADYGKPSKYVPKENK